MRWLGLALLSVFVLGATYLYLDRTGAFEQLGALTEATDPVQRPDAADAERGTTARRGRLEGTKKPNEAGRQPGHQAKPAKARSDNSDGSAIIATVVGIMGALGATFFVLAIILAGLRYRARRTRRYERLAIDIYRAEEADAEHVRRLVEALHQNILERWYRRLLFGQPGIALEAHAIPHSSGTQIRLSIAIPAREGLREAINGLLASCYRDSRLVQGGGEPQWTGEIVRLKRRYPGFGRSLVTAFDHRDRLHVIDAVLATMQGTGRPCTLQLALVPTPALFDRLARSGFKAREREVESGARMRDGADAGTRSPLERQEFSGSAEGVQNRPLFFCDLRVAADEYATARSVAATIKGASSADNRLIERRLRRWPGPFAGRHPLYERRVRKAWPNPFPAWRKGVFSSAEVAALWHLPSPFLKSINLGRTSVPRVPGPPDLMRPGYDRALLRDEHGYIGMRAEDRPMNLALLGGQGTGKTSVICRAVAANALDSDCAQIVLDGKNDLAFKALSVIPDELPGGRKVHFLDFAHPEIGINPFEAGMRREETADALVAAFKEIVSEGGIRESSERYLQQAALAAMGWAEKTAAPGGATLWDVWALLLPGEEADDFRREVVQAISTDPELAAPAYFFGRQLPEQLQKSQSMMIARLDAPVNKVQTIVGKPQLDAILRHPHTVRIDEIIRNRDILVVAGSAGLFGEGAAVVLLQILVGMVHRALIRQQDLPENERPRVALAVDEAHLLFSPTFGRMLNMDRSSGLECMSAWQTLGQIEDRNLCTTILDAHRQKCLFSLAGPDAQEVSQVLQVAFASVVRDDPEARARMRVSPDALMHLPNYNVACSWISAGSRMPSFVAQTLPMEDDPDRIAGHLERQRSRGAHFPGTLAPPERIAAKALNPDLVERSPKAPEHTGQQREDAVGRGRQGDDKPTVPAKEGERVAKDVGGDREPAKAMPDFDPDNSSFDDSRDRIGIAPLGSDTGAAVPPSYTELDVLDEVEGLRWAQPATSPSKPRTPQRDELELLAALYELRFLLSTQIARRLLPQLKERSVQHRLTQLHKAGLVRRAEFKLAPGGGAPRLYTLSEKGHALLREHRGATRIARDMPAEEKWRETQVRSPLAAVHDVHVSAWLFAFEALVRDEVLKMWWGPGRSILWPPARKERGEWVRLRADEIKLGQRQSLDGLALEEFEPVKPDLRVELDLSMAGQTRKVDLLIEMDRTGRASSNADKFKRYDAMLNGWALSTARYKALGEAPVAIFVVEDDEKARQFLALADRLMTGRIVTWGKDEADWPHYGRKRLFVVAERDVHMGTLRALRLPEHPPKLRRKLGGKRAEKLVAEQVPWFLPPAFQRRGFLLH